MTTVHFEADIDDDDDLQSLLQTLRTWERQHQHVQMAVKMENPQRSVRRVEEIFNAMRPEWPYALYVPKDDDQTVYYNEACATCGVPRDLHRNADDPPETSMHTTWGWLTCRKFVRCDPPRAAYGVLGQ